MKKKSFSLVVTLLVVILCYAVMEVGVRIVESKYPFGILGVKPGFERIKERAAAESNTNWKAWALKKNRDLLDGARLTLNETKDQWQTGARYKVLLFGDSVSVGKYLHGGDPYPATVDNILSDQRGQLINLAVDGFGIDQMIVKALQVTNRFDPDVIVIAYIAHNLLRVGSTFMYDLPKIKLRFTNNVVSLDMAEGVDSFYQRYVDAKNHGALSLWTLGFMWSNKEYILPSFFEDYYEKVYSALRSLIDKNAATLSARVVFVRLSNTTEFRNRERLTELAEKVFGETLQNSTVVGHFDTDDCTKNEAENMGLDWRETFSFHPGQTGSDILGLCVARLLEAVAIH